ncbi:hypothetical protein Aperf_G00000021412 [Anoplocephala perfoliata]
MSTEHSLSYNDSYKGANGSTASLFAPEKQDEPPSDARIKGPPQSKGFAAPQLSSITKMSLSELDSLMEPFTRPRTDAFSVQEIKLMIEEIGKVRHILLSKSRPNRKLVKEAWEEVASNMALRCPKRSAKQIKRKWRDIVSKTKKKLREGRLKQEMQFNEITALVTRFLTSTGKEMQQREKTELNEEVSPFMTQQPQLGTYYDHADNPGNSGNANVLDTENMVTSSPDDGTNATDINRVQPTHGLSACEEGNGIPSSDIGVVTTSHSIHNSADDGDDYDDDSSDSDVVIVAHSLANRPSSNGDSENSSRGRKEKVLKDEFLRQSKAEHALRMEILQLKRRYWQLKTDALLHGRQIFVVESETQRDWQ